ncbi:ECF transporter S component [Furfurilactobacillus entadae]|uniref:ECF transporter S component n=1 Tax=Furfurilactobacillus entadae TaxID=2922307 RepID=UPI0035EE66F7
MQRHFGANIATPRYITFIAMMTAICVVGRYIFQFLPNIQPVTDILIFLTIYYSFAVGVFVSILSILISNILLGFGPWTIPQIMAYLVVVLVVTAASHLRLVNRSIIVQSGLALLMGYLYGFTVSLGQLPVLGGWHQVIVYWLGGLSFDTLHAGGNLVIYLICMPALKQTFIRLHNHIPVPMRYQD